MSAFIDISTGAGLASSTGVRPYLPPLLAGGLARGDIGIDFDGTDFSFLESPAFLAARACARRGGLPRSSARARRAPARACGRGPSGVAAGSRARRAAVRRRARRRRRRGAGRAPRSGRCARRSAGSPSAALVRARRAAGSSRDQAALLTAYADGAALILAAIAIFVPPLALLAHPRLRRAARRRAPARGREVRGAADPAVVPKKLVLAVIDSLKPDMLDQAIAEGDAPALAALLDRGTYIRDCVSTFPSVTPVASAAIATGCGPGRAPHPVDELVPPRRGALRRVRLVASPPRAPSAIVRSLYDTVYNMNLAHLTPGAQDGLRAPRRRRAADRLHHLPDLPRPHAPRPVGRERATGGSPRRPSSATRSTAPRELFYADLFDSRDTGCTSDARHARPARPAHRLRGRLPGRERPLRLPALLAARQRHLLAQARARRARSRSIAEADRALERIMHVAGGADAFLEEHAVIVMSDHSQTAVEARINLADVLGGHARAHARATPRRPRREMAACPSARSAQVYVLDDGAPRRAGARARPTRCSRPTGVDLVVTARGRRRRSCAPPRGELRFAPGRRPTRRARRAAGASTGDEARARRSTRRTGGWTARPTRTRSAGSGRRSRARTPATCWSRPSSATSSSTGAASTTWAAAATARSTADDSEGVLLLCGVGRARDARAVVDRRRDPAGARTLRCTVGRVTDEARAAIADRPHAIHLRVRARAGASRTTGCSSSSSARSARPATW